MCVCACGRNEMKMIQYNTHGSICNDFGHSYFVRYNVGHSDSSDNVSNFISTL